MRKLGNFELLGELRKDNYTTLYRARDIQSNREVALRILASQGIPKPELIEQFKRNAQAAIELSHPHIAPAYDVGGDEETVYLVMRHIRGRTLRQYLDQHERLTLRRALPILTQLAEAIDYVHGQGMLYKFLDPSGVIFETEDEPPSVMITDLAEREEEFGGKDQESFPHVVTLAALTFELLLGRPPINGEMDTQQEGSPEKDLSSFLQDIPRLIEDAETNAQFEPAIFPAGLYSSAGELVEALQAENDRLISDEWLKVQSLAMRVAQDEGSQTEALAIIAEAAAALYREKKIEDERQQIAKLYKQGEQAVEEKNWEGAVAVFENVASIDPGYREVQDLLSHATSERLLDRLFNQATFQVRGGDLIQACRSWVALLKEQWDYRSGLAVVHFIDGVQELLDQMEPNEHRRNGNSKERDLSELESMLQIPASDELDQFTSETTKQPDVLSRQDSEMAGDSLQDSFLTDDELNQLAMKPTKQLDQILEQEQPMEGKTPENSVLTTDGLNQLAAKPTGQLDETHDRESTLAKAAVNTVLTSDDLNQLAAKPTERLDGAPVKESRTVGNGNNVSIMTADELNQLASKQTELLADSPGLKSVRPKRQLHSDRTIWRTDGKEIVRVPSGEFLFGPESKLVFLDEFWIDKTPVTNAEYKRFLEANPSHLVPYSDLDEASQYCWDKNTRSYPDGMADHPVVLVSLSDARSYAMWAGKRLATEQEWEKAARGIDGRGYPWGNSWRNQACNNIGLKIGGTTPVGKFTPNGDSPYGCVDMCGNTWEWTSSEYNESTMVMRGGSWGNDRNDVRCTQKSLSIADTIGIHIGFRLVLTTMIPD